MFMLGVNLDLMCFSGMKKLHLATDDKIKGIYKVLIAYHT